MNKANSILIINAGSAATRKTGEKESFTLYPINIIIWTTPNPAFSQRRRNILAVFWLTGDIRVSVGYQFSVASNLMISFLVLFFVVVLLAFSLKESPFFRDLDSSYTVSCVCTGLRVLVEWFFCGIIHFTFVNDDFNFRLQFRLL